MPRIDHAADAKFSAAIQKTTAFSGILRALAVVPKTPAKPDPNAIIFGAHELGPGEIFFVKLLDGRLLIQGASGAGKSCGRYAARLSKAQGAPSSSY